MVPTPTTPLDGFGAAAGWRLLTDMALVWVALFVVAGIAVAIARMILVRRRERVECPEQGRAAAVIDLVRDDDGTPADVTACSLRPGERTLRCGKSCLHEAA